MMVKNLDMLFMEKLMNGDEEYEVKKGETFYLKGNLPHYIVNKHDTLAKVIWVSTPPIF